MTADPHSVVTHAVTPTPTPRAWTARARASTIALAVLVMAAPVAARAQPLILQPGQDGFITQPGSFFELPLALPTGFFGSKGGNPSDVVPAGTVLTVGPGPDLVSILQATTFLTGPGCHTGSENHHCYKQVLVELVPIFDTVVERDGLAILPVIGASQSVGIQLVHLSLMTVDPLMVTYGGLLPSFYDLIVSLDGAQPPGTLTLHRTGESGGTMDTELPVQYKVRFAGRDPGDPTPQQPEVGGLQDVLRSTGNTFQAVPEPSSVALTAGGLLLLAGVWRRRRAAA